MPSAHRLLLAVVVAAACGDDANVVTSAGSETTDAVASTVTAAGTTTSGSSESSPADTSSSSSSSSVDSSSDSSTTEHGVGPLLDVGAGETGDVPSTCIDAPDEIHVLVSSTEIWRFDVPTVSFELVATLDCPELADAVSVDSFSIARDGDVWLLSRHPEDPQVPQAWPMQITRHTPGSGTCEVVWYGALPESADCGDMAFASMLDDPDHERLFIHQCTGGGFLLDAFPAPRLYRIDPEEDMPAPLALGEDTFSTAPIAGTGDGRLYGIAGNDGEPDSTIVVEFDQESGAVTSTLSAAGMNIGVNAGQLALAFYGGDLYTFGIDIDVEAPNPVPELVIASFDLDDDDGNGEHDIEQLAPALPLPFLSWTISAAASPTCIPVGPAG